ncbi:MAG: Holliday junction branch migration protein RuvA [Treponema sp.]|jgi:Holliday junction DNA helicase RuvA|nr:Holliday junction branch migration protein RuvA [Treponema sp.]
MFNSIRGTVTGKRNDILYLTTGGVEWDITVPATDNARLPPVGETATVWTWLYHKEDSMRLFGFAGEMRRSTFLELLKVEGIGPKGAIKIMGGIEQEELEHALDSEDLGRLEKVPGLGKKTAQKMLLALKGKLAHTPAAAAETVSPYADLVEALAAMGYDKRAAAEAISKAEAGLRADGALDGSLAISEKEKLLFKQAILYLSGM